MTGIIGTCSFSFRLLSLCGVKLKILVVFGLLFLALSPVIELYLVKLLADFILSAGEVLSDMQKLFSVAQILMLLVLVYTLRYLVKVGRVSFINHLMNRLQSRSGSVPAWLRAVLIEQVQIIAIFVQLLAMGAACFYISPFLGVSFCIAFFLFYFISNRLYLNQLLVQKKLRFNNVDTKHEVGNHKVYQRVRAQEISSAFGSFTAALMFFCLLGLVALEALVPVSALVGLFLVRLYNVTLGMFCGSAMRMARALAYVELPDILDSVKGR
ncbi:hypothetical protein [Marinobacter nauticus]|jgi:hypothetical protein|uniref:hypothetical protein n=1 Tax=Marinobacter nauticus TaxID=2743 RepID=UPI001C94B11E|nr:hypothetical protein [Marinobacter nauticus]MBY6104742.1 hypothetical protein [Marinobacter nauticus]